MAAISSFTFSLVAFSEFHRSRRYGQKNITQIGRGLFEGCREFSLLLRELRDEIGSLRLEYGMNFVRTCAQRLVQIVATFVKRGLQFGKARRQGRADFVDPCSEDAADIPDAVGKPRIEIV